MHTETQDEPGKRRKRYPRHIDRPSPILERGYACVALDRPTDGVNIGHAMRASFCFGARAIIIGEKPHGVRVDKILTDPMRTHRHIPVIETKCILSTIPKGCSVVSIERCEEAIPLMEFNHPERACYLFGPENGSVAQQLLAKSDHKVMIPTNAPLNLGMTVNIVLYDRLSKSWNKTKSRRHRIEKLNAAG